VRYQFGIGVLMRFPLRGGATFGLRRTKTRTPALVAPYLTQK
jgi:hypothetical protein